MRGQISSESYFLIYEWLKQNKTEKKKEKPVKVNDMHYVKIVNKLG